MEETYLKDTVVAKRHGVHRTTPWRWSTKGTGFPKPVMLSPGCTRWRLSDLGSGEGAFRYNRCLEVFLIGIAVVVAVIFRL